MILRTINLPNKHSFFLFGPRGCGKTTLIKKRYLDSKALHIDLLDSDQFNQYSLSPSLLNARIEATKGVQRVIIDEVQKVPALLDHVHKIIEENKKLQFILTGSSARKLKRGGANLLAGRAFVFNLHSFTSQELGDQFSLESALNWGMLPKLLELDDDIERKEYLRAYANTYLKEEILQEQLIRKLEPFQRFLPIAAQTSGKIVNFAKIAKDVGAAPQTVENYFYILTDTLLGNFLPAYNPSVRKQERVLPKFYLFDLGVKRSLAKHLEIPVYPETYAYGVHFEHFVLHEILKLSSYKRRDDSHYYYQTHSGVEIDLVIERPGLPLALIEIKSTDNVKIDAVRNLNSICADFKNAQSFCFSNDPDPKQFGYVRCVHWRDGLEELGL